MTLISTQPPRYSHHWPARIIGAALIASGLIHLGLWMFTGQSGRSGLPEETGTFRDFWVDGSVPDLDRFQASSEARGPLAGCDHVFLAVG